MESEVFYRTIVMRKVESPGEDLTIETERFRNKEIEKVGTQIIPYARDDTRQYMGVGVLMEACSLPVACWRGNMVDVIFAYCLLKWRL